MQRPRERRGTPSRPSPDHSDERVFHETLDAGLAVLQLALSSSALDLFTTHYRELMRWRRRADLTSLADARAVAVRHFLDSLTLAPFIPASSRVADLGSGAGFPGVPLAIARPDLQVTLLETRQLKLAFLHHLATQLRLPNLEIGDGSAEQVAMDVVVARAVANVGETLARAQPRVRPGGLVFLMRGPRREQEEPSAGFRLVDEHQLTLPLDDAPRRILVFERASRWDGARQDPRFT